jgi:DNA-binding GntR family transcriptional regulator
VLEALRARDPDLATDVLHRHFEHAAAGLASRWTDEGATAVSPIGVAATPAST